MITKILLYKKDIENIAKLGCYCCKTWCFAFPICLVSKLYFNKFPNDF